MVIRIKKSNSIIGLQISLIWLMVVSMFFGATAIDVYMLDVQEREGVDHPSISLKIGFPRLNA